MSRSRSFRDFWRSVFFFFYMPRGSFFQNSAIFWHRDRGVKFSPRSEKRPEGENTHPSPQNCARRIWEDRGTDGTMGLLGAVPPPLSIFTLPIRQRDSTISWSGWGGAGGRGGRSPSPPAPGKGREAGLCLGAARRRPALPPASLPRLPASPRGTA
jgi:hypothetical protein